ncbi:hypothetical protein A2757_02420 [Candidatus Giovannonibacteria bacterium RIFCSPHIGHO2_01_FULL_48_47]|nr:MAG: hypothetical protein A2757_02420 [Candidatus Giovannonibacteria bacterium RIFCSPHIGHO2_01_FULL_48_47]OGF68610.1 MAG: hypothetical protein A3D61_01740 [Candidatus Giovannonibacteria bacterium RIFCSPHIGHO2_02_FULL_48_15]OGF88502.1 MAG: hypothetical protein A3B26_02125 [Candidatus Giovannonibacteria bacterium RIFCSPLOWO2_01_FULL_48_47]OGF95454.1 MAG: hypothetical protein A2433_00335 [Candidatus Giovannonibacteria bacterium RIFOXYC1_FULL_48_8]OGF96468.1 MAG: hypothetical protein A2613_02855
MGLFDEKSHIKSSKELKGLVKGLKLGPKEKKELFKMAKPETLRPSGLSKKELNKIIDRADKENLIDHSDAYRLKKYGR